MEELGQITRIEEEDLSNFINQELIKNQEEEEEEEFDPNQEFNIEENDLLNEIELVGETFWENVSELGDKTRELATELIIRFIDGTFGGSRSLPTYVSRPLLSNDFFELDIDSTIEASIEEPSNRIKPWVFERETSRNPVLLLLDTSFSMSGQKLMIAGIIVGTLARLIPSKDLCVLGFARKPYYVKRFDEEVSIYHLISRIMRLIPKGHTDLASAMIKGSELLYPFENYSKFILLSDADPTVGKNPITESSRIKQLDLLLFPDGNEWVAKKIVHEVFHGRLYRINNYQEIPAIIRHIFSGNH